MNSLNTLLQNSIKRNWDFPAFSNLNGEIWLYKDVAARILALQEMFRSADIHPGDKIALCGKNTKEWATAFLAIVGYGAVAVPLLHEFPVDVLDHLIAHSDSRLLFSDVKTIAPLHLSDIKKLKGVINLDDFKPLQGKHLRYAELKDLSDTESFTLAADTPDDIAVINYTSGSTGFSKGVMLPRRSLISNLNFATENITYLYPHDGIISMLPLAHLFGLSIEFLFPFLKGCHITFLGKTPAPTIILKAFADVKPKLIIAVPLIIEKIVINKIFPALKKQPAKTLLAIPGLRNIVYKKIRRQLLDAFGGNLMQLIVGGAPINAEVEDLLMKIKFPITVGYGMTECGPLIAYEVWNKRPKGSCGKVVDNMKIRIDSPDPLRQAGELWVKGDNVMKGYYHAPEIDAETFRDGWMNTGDLCQIDKNGYLYIRGRNKTMLLGPSGQNIYPEEIEAKLSHLPLVSECLIVSRDHRLTALIVPDFEAVKKQNLTPQQVEEQMKRNIAELNGRVAPYEKVSSYEIMDKEFEKTPKRSIKRFLYS